MNVTDIGNRKQLFIDDRWFAAQRGMTLRVNPPIKAERVIVPDRPWEARNISAYSTVLDDDGVYRMWYDAIAPKPPEANHIALNRFICYAESDDGLHWRRGEVNRFTWNGITENNIVAPGSEGGVMKDPHSPDEHRYKALMRIWRTDLWPASANVVCPRWEGEKFIATSELYLCTSADGLAWSIIGAVSDYFHDTLNHFFYDRRLRKYVAYVRTHARGRTVGRLEIDDPMAVPWIALNQPRESSAQRFTTALSRDDADPPDTDLYTPCVHQYPWADDSYYFSFTTPYRHYPYGDTSDTTQQGKDERGRFRNSGPVDIQLAVSRDGVLFHRPDRTPYVPLGLDGQWDSGQAYMALGMIRRGDEIWMYYCGTPHVHGAYPQDAAERRGGLARLVQRLDGFVCAEAAYEGANFTTPLLTFTGAHLQLNVDGSALGQVWVELRDEHNHPIPGYALAECIDIDRNHIAAPVRWQQRDDVSALIGRPVRMHIKARACRLYAFQFCDDEQASQT